MNKFYIAVVAVIALAIGYQLGNADGYERGQSAAQTQCVEQHRGYVPKPDPCPECPDVKEMADELLRIYESQNQLPEGTTWRPLGNR